MEINLNEVYYDILLEKKIQTIIKLDQEIEAINQETLNGRIRIYDGEKWYISNYIGAGLEKLLQEAQGLLKICKPVNIGNIIRYRGQLGDENIDLNEFPIENYEKKVVKKIDSLKELQRKLSARTYIKYQDLYLEKRFVSAHINRSYNLQNYGIGIRVDCDGKWGDVYVKNFDSFKEMESQYHLFVDYCNKYMQKVDAYTMKLHKYLGDTSEIDFKYDNKENEDWNMPLPDYCPFDDNGIIKMKSIS